MLLLPSLLLALPAQLPEATLTVDSASFYSSYGETVAVTGDWVFVGAPDDQLNGSNYVGSVYAFRKTPTGWVEHQRLTASNGSLFFTFGHALAADGDRVVIGAPDTLGGGNGGAYVFRFDGHDWVEEQILSQTTGWSGDWFGWSVDIQGDRILVGSMWSRQPGLNWGGPNHAGAAWVFHFDGASWQLEQELGASDMDGYDLFGTSVSLDGSTLVVGARGEGDPAGAGGAIGFIGAVYVFDLVAGVWTETQKLRASNFSEDAWFGEAVALDAPWLLVGSPGKTGGGIYGKGAAYLFHRLAGTFSETEKIEFSRTSVFGRDVAMDGELAVVTSGGQDFLGNLDGAIHPLRRDGAVWVAEPALNPGDLGPWDLFGQDVDLEGSRMVSCGYLESLPPSLSPGAGYVYDLAPRFHLMVSPFPLELAEDAKFELRFGAANAPAWMAYSLQGPGSTAVPPLGVVLDLANPQQLAAPTQTDGQGYTKWEMPIPPAALGLTVWFQGMQSGQTTNPFRTDIQ